MPILAWFRGFFLFSFLNTVLEDPKDIFLSQALRRDGGFSAKPSFF